MNDLEKIRVIKPAFDTVHEALEGLVKDVDIWNHKDLTFMLLKTLFYVKGSRDEMNRLLKLEDGAPSGLTGNPGEDRRENAVITEASGSDIN